MNIQSVGIIGGGAFGRFTEELIKKHAPHVSVKTYKRRHSEFDLEQVAQCDVVIFAVPISAYRSTLELVVPLTRSDTILVDIATVKEHTVELLQKLNLGRHWIATHPMFGPGSYAKNDNSIEGFTVVLAGNTSIIGLESLCKCIEQVGLKIVRMSPGEHDKVLAETLFITHLVAQTLKRAKFLPRTKMDTPSVHLLKDAADIVHNDTELFKDVVRYNRYCREAMVRWHQAQSWVWELIVDAM